MTEWSYIVGEKGPELFVSDQAGQIVTDEQLAELQGMIDKDDNAEVRNRDDDGWSR